jgi:toxin HigB-1
MIKSWGNSPTRRFYETGKGRFSGLHYERAVVLLAALDEAASLKELGPLRSLGLHKLKGNRGGQWAITVNVPWRICFKFHDGDAFEVEIVDYH